jgi:imidazolonepropionase-like amidohydrolase
MQAGSARTLTHATTRAARALALVAGVLLLFGCGGEPGPTVDVRRPAAVPDAVLIENVAVLDVESGLRTEGMDVLLRGERIASVGAHGSLADAAGAQVIPGEGATLVPGLIDMHGHVYSNTDPSWSRGLPTPEANLAAYAYAGVTTVFDPADNSGEAFARREQVARGELVGPRIFSTGPLLTCADGHPVATIQELAPWWIGWYLAGVVAIQIPDVETANTVVDEVAVDGADAVKIVIDSIPLQAPRMSLEIARAAVARARSHGLRTVAHIGTTQDAIDAGDAGVALWVHGVYKERIPDDKIAVLAGYGIPMVATTEVFDRYARSLQPIEPTRLERETVPEAVLASFHPVPEGFDPGSLSSWLELARATTDTRIDNVRRLREAGVTILAGSDTQSGVFPGAGLHRELAHLVRAGFTPAEAIRAATLEPARFLANGGEPDAGIVAPGKRADLLLVEGDPTLDVAVLADLREVFLAGVPIERRPVENGAR